MNANEPFIWVKQDFDGEWIEVHAGKGIPLYTHPEKEYKPNQTLECSFDLAGFKPPANTLTDEEIWEVINRTAWVGTEEEIRFKIAEAILRKANEK